MKQIDAVGLWARQSAPTESGKIAARVDIPRIPRVHMDAHVQRNCASRRR
jgi:hypothetical protein